MIDHSCLCNYVDVGVGEIREPVCDCPVHKTVDEAANRILLSFDAYDKPQEAFSGQTVKEE